MASTVRSLSNHYETLQITPTASKDEIVAAFSSQMRIARLRPDISVTRLAQLSVAYETLRDPIKRRAYDDSLGLTPEPPPTASHSPTPAEDSAIERLHRLAEQFRTPPPRQKGLSVAEAEARVAAFIAASHGEPVSKAGAEPSAPPTADAPETAPEEVFEESPQGFIDEDAPAGDGAVAISRSGATFGAGVIGIAILACAAALPDRNPVPVKVPPAATPTVTVPLPPAATAEGDPAALHSPTTMAAIAPPALKTRPHAAVLASQAQASPPGPAEDSGSEQASAESPPLETSAERAASQTPVEAAAVAPDEPAPVTTAKMPLPSSTIARTIERIGFRCGRVISTSGVEGASGAYKINCSSGDTYRAAPVHGRYRFRRWDRD